MVPLFPLSLIFLLIINTTSSLTHHVININSSTLQFSSLEWDATARHFVVGSAMDPVVYAISDGGTIKCLLSEHSSNSNGVFVTALAVDQIRLRLIVTFSNPSSVSAYDLKSYRRIYAMPLPQLDGAPSGAVVDLESGEVFVSSASRGVLLKVGPYGDTLQEIVLSAPIKLFNNVSNLADTSVGNNHTLSKRIISELKNFDDEGLGGIMYLSHGYILVLQTTTGKIFKVDTIDGTVTEVLHRDSSIPLAPSGHAMSLQTEKSIVVATNQSLLLIESDDNRWTRAATIRNKMNMEEGEMVVAIAMQEGEKEKENVYVLVNSKKGYRIEEVIWRESNYVSWCLVLGLCIFLLLWFMWVEYFNDKPFYGNWDWKGYDHENVPWCLVLGGFLWVFVLFWFIWDAFFNDKIKAILWQEICFWFQKR